MTGIRLLGICVALEVALLPVAARAGSCAPMCPQQLADCKIHCSGDKDPKAAKLCVSKCDEQASFCPELCDIAEKNKGDPERLRREVKAAVERRERAKSRGK